MLAKDIMSAKPVSLPPTTTLDKAAAQMKSNDCGFIPVTQNDQLLGIITDRDIVIKGIAVGKDPGKTMLQDIMTKGTECCMESDNLDKVVTKMKDKQIRRLIVCNQDKKITGVISLGDIAKKTQDSKLCGELTKSISQD